MGKETTKKQPETIEEFQVALAKSQEEISAKNNAIETLESELSATKEEVAAKGKVIGKLELDLSEARGAVDEKNAEIEEQSATIIELNTRLSKHEEALKAAGKLNPEVTVGKDTYEVLTGCTWAGNVYTKEELAEAKDVVKEIAKVDGQTIVVKK